MVILAFLVGLLLGICGLAGVLLMGAPIPIMQCGFIAVIGAVLVGSAVVAERVDFLIRLKTRELEEARAILGRG